MTTHLSTSLFIAFLFVFSNQLHANNTEDSLLNSLENKSKIEQAKIFLELFKATYRTDLNKAETYIIKAEIFEKNNPDSLVKAMINNNYGLLNVYRGNYKKSIEYFNVALVLYEALGDSNRIADCYNNFGLVHDDQGDFVKALKMYMKSYTMANKTNYTSCLVNATNNIGLIYAQQGDLLSALPFFKKSFEGQKKLNNYKGIGNTANNLAMVYHMTGKDDSSKYFFDLALKIWVENNDQRGQAMTYNNLASYYEKIGDLKNVRTCLNKSLEISYEIKDSYGITQNFQQLLSLYQKQNNRDSAYYIANKLLQRSTELNLKPNMKAAYLILSEMFEEDKKFKKAFENYKLYSEMKDSIFNESKSKEIGKLEATYEMEKKQAEEERLQIENLKLEIEKKERRDNIQYSIIFIAILTVFGTILSFGFIKVSPKFAEGLIFFAFLLFFEFCLVLLDPYIDDWSSGEPAYKLLFNAVLAGAIFPAHAFFENTLKKKLKVSA